MEKKKPYKTVELNNISSFDQLIEHMKSVKYLFENIPITVVIEHINRDQAIIITRLKSETENNS